MQCIAIAWQLAELFRMCRHVCVKEFRQVIWVHIELPVQFVELGFGFLRKISRHRTDHCQVGRKASGKSSVDRLPADFRRLSSTHTLKSFNDESGCLTTVVEEILRESAIVDFRFQGPDRRENLLRAGLSDDVISSDCGPVRLGKSDQYPVLIQGRKPPNSILNLGCGSVVGDGEVVNKLASVSPLPVIHSEDANSEPFEIGPVDLALESQ